MNMSTLACAYLGEPEHFSPILLVSYQDFHIFLFCLSSCAARVILDRESGRSRGFGFVSFADNESATSALAMDGQVRFWVVFESGTWIILYSFDCL